MCEYKCDIQHLFQDAGYNFDSIMYIVMELKDRVEILEKQLDAKSKLAGAAAIKVEAVANVLKAHRLINMKDLDRAIVSITKDLTSISQNEVKQLMENKNEYLEHH